MRSLILLVACLCTLPVIAADSAAASDGSQITAPEFEKKIDLGFAVITAKRPFSAEEAVMFVRLSNTLFLIDREMTKKETELQKLMWGSEFSERLKEALGDAVINKGMGYYFPKHDLHWGGSGGNIRDRDRYHIIFGKKKEGANQAAQTTPGSFAPLRV